ncbi:hypothetical protein ACJMK2_019644 [Sinanodonta woodiana]|uniref:Ammonium transporter AmtB-like domain-containing protein n=1 Tax=Sinanodonta woodiana TaxID=1069815 RepID=A0ABD3TZ42_SINWO
MADEVNASIDNIVDLGISVGILESNLDQFLLIIMGLCLLFMQSGFALLEAGSVRSKNVTNILIKNVCDSFICGVSYWLFGFAFAYGEGNQFIGYTHFAITDLPANRYGYFFFQFTFTATAATIVSGAMAERCEFMAYFIFSFIMTSFIYPLVTHWTWWHDGFLFQGKDYGGDIGWIGYRLSTLGGFILFFGFLTFNGASQLSLSKAGDGEAISLAIVNTMITATFASFTATFVYRIPRFGSGAWCITVASNGAITGMVASCAGCNVFYPWGSCILGIVAGLTYHVWCWIVRTVRVDDPTDAVAMNLGGGTLGVITVGLLDRNKGILLKWNLQSGLFLGWQLAGLVVIMCWTAFWSAISFGIMRWMKILRVPEDIELKGYSNMAMTFQELNDKGPYEHPEVVAERRRKSSVAMRDVHVDSLSRKSSRSIHQLHEMGSHEHPEWRPPLSHQLNHTITEVNEESSIDSSDFKKIHTKEGSISYELDVSLDNPAFMRI